MGEGLSRLFNTEPDLISLKMEKKLSFKENSHHEI